MTRDKYFEMCEMLQAEPIEEEIPIEFEDLHEEVQEALILYNMLQDNWDTMNGVYLGKVMIGIYDLFELMEIEYPKSCYYIIGVIDRTRGDILNKKNKPAE